MAFNMAQFLEGAKAYGYKPNTSVDRVEVLKKKAQESPLGFGWRNVGGPVVSYVFPGIDDQRMAPGDNRSVGERRTGFQAPEGSFKGFSAYIKPRELSTTRKW